MFRIKILLLLTLCLTVFGFSLTPVVTHAQVGNQLKAGVNAASGGSDQCDTGRKDRNGNPITTTDPQQCLNRTIGTVVNILSSLVGVVAVIMIIIGGFRYVTSAGNAESAKGAKNTILYAIIGLVIVAIAQIIVRFVLHTVT